MYFSNDCKVSCGIEMCWSLSKKSLVLCMPVIIKNKDSQVSKMVEAIKKKFLQGPV